MHSIISKEEHTILESLISIRYRLGLLKKDKSKFFKASDVTQLFQQFCTEVSKLKETRKSEHHDDDIFHNRLDDVIDDIYQLFSLFWMALGKNREIPATYVQLTTIIRSLSLFNELNIYTKDDLIPYQKRLCEIESLIKNATLKNDGLPPIQVDMIQKKFRVCSKLMDELLASFDTIGDELLPIRKCLIEIRKKIAQLNSNQGPETHPSLSNIQEELRNIDSLRVDGKFVSDDNSIPPGQAQLIGLLDQCFEEVHDLVASNDVIPEYLKPIHQRLLEIKGQLEHFLMTHRWSLRETDLWTYQVQLEEIEAFRRDGRFQDPSDESSDQPSGQCTLSFILHKCYHLIYRLLLSSEPIAESLSPIHNQLLTLRRCLLELKKWGGPFTVRELYPYQMKLASLDNMRVEGKYLDPDGNIPEGQGIVMSLLNECYDILYELRASIDEE